MVCPTTTRPHCGLSFSVGANNAYLLAPFEYVAEVVDKRATTRYGVADVVQFEYFAAYAFCLDRYLRADLVDTRESFLLQFIECVDACPRLGAASLRHTAHPLQFGAVQAAGFLVLYALIVLTLGLLLHVVVVGAAIAVETAVVEFEDVVAHAVEEVAVVGDHKDCQPLTRKELFEPLNHVDVEVVGGLIEDEEVGVVEQYATQCHLLLLSSAELLYGTVHECVEPQSAQDFLHALLEGPFVLVLHALRGIDEVAHRLHGVECRRLRQIGHLDTFAERHLAVVGQHAAGYDVEQGALAITVAGDKGGLLACVDAEGYVLKQQLVAVGLSEVFYRKQRIGHGIND